MKKKPKAPVFREPPVQPEAAKPAPKALPPVTPHSPAREIDRVAYPEPLCTDNLPVYQLLPKHKL